MFDEVKAYDVAYSSGAVVRVIATSEEEAINLSEHGIGLIIHGMIYCYDNDKAVSARVVEGLSSEEADMISHIGTIRSNAKSDFSYYRDRLRDMLDDFSNSQDSDFAAISDIVQAARELDMMSAIYNEFVIRRLDLFYDKGEIEKVAADPTFFKNVVDSALSDQEGEMNIIERAWRHAVNWNASNKEDM